MAKVDKNNDLAIDNGAKVSLSPILRITLFDHIIVIDKGYCSSRNQYII